VPRRDKVRDSKKKQRAALPSTRVGKNPKTKAKRAASTPNGQLIQDLMARQGVKGSYKDYVLLAGNRLVDWTGSWDIMSPGGNPVGYEGVVLLHKSKMRGVIDSPLVERLWHPTLGSRIQRAPKKD